MSVGLAAEILRILDDGHYDLMREFISKFSGGSSYFEIEEFIRRSDLRRDEPLLAPGPDLIGAIVEMKP